MLPVPQDQEMGRMRFVVQDLAKQEMQVASTKEEGLTSSC